MRYLSENNNEFGISTDEKEKIKKDRLPWQRHVLDFLEIKRNEKKQQQQRKTDPRCQK